MRRQADNYVGCGPWPQNVRDLLADRLGSASRVRCRAVVAEGDVGWSSSILDLGNLWTKWYSGQMDSNHRRAFRTARLRWRSVAVGLATILACGTAVAQGTDPADAAIRRGVDLRRQGQDDQALQQFKKAYELSPSPRALAQIGLAEQALGRWVDAETHLEAALGSKRDTWIQKNGAILRGALDAIAKHLGNVQVLGEPVGAEVLIQGKVVGHLPMVSPSRVPIGDAQIEVRHPG